MSLLGNIKSPDDLKKLGKSELPDLADEIRAVIVDVVSRNGGHLASSLGAVELAIAIHYVFDVPHDSVIWDVGHQAYAHKLLTGRSDSFHTLRKLGGISGFPKISESACDAFSTGHSSTSISAGFGMACANGLAARDSKVISVIGDGSLTGGIAYEALNHAGNSNKNHLVILNDNEMSISRNVGALSSFLSRTFSAKYIHDLKREFKRFFKSLPKIGDDVYQFAKRTEESFKTFVTPGMLFEAFNFEYFGPIDGHNLEHLVEILSNVKKLSKPVLLHVTTKKGKGYTPAEKNPVHFHGVGSFQVESGLSNGKPKKIPTYTDVFGKTLSELAREDERIVAITAAMPEGTGLVNFSGEFPDRFFDVGIAEQHAVTFAAGMATRGMKPVVAIYSTFLQRAYDQIVHDVCLENLPVIFAIDRGGIVGEDGPTHHGLFDLSYLRNLPNLMVMAPRDEEQLRRMLKTAVLHDGPVAIRYPRGTAVGVETGHAVKPIAPGKAQLLREGEDVLLLSVGKMAGYALEAAEELAGMNISAAVMDARFVKPLDAELISTVALKTGCVVTVEDHMRAGGFGSAVLECLSDQGICNVKCERVGIADTFVEHGTCDELYEKYHIDVPAIVQAAKKLVSPVCLRRPSGGTLF